MHRPTRADPTAHAQACIESGHLIPQHGSRQCTTCKQVAPANGCGKWMRENACPGPPLPSANGRIARHPGGRPVSVSNQALHDSHNIHWLTKEETWACLRCGSVAQRKAVNLSRPCCPGLGGKRLCKRLGLDHAAHGRFFAGRTPGSHGCPVQCKGEQAGEASSGIEMEFGADRPPEEQAIAPHPGGNPAHRGGEPLGEQSTARALEICLRRHWQQCRTDK